jgi:hypothetical protein
MSTRAAHLAELHGLADTNSGPTLDGTRESLVGLDEWLRVILAGPFDDHADWQVVWSRRDPDFDMGRGWRFHMWLRMVERVALYYADVAIGALPGSRWVCWRSTSYNEIKAGKFLLDLGIYPDHHDPLYTTQTVFDSIGLTYRDPSDPDYRPTQDRTLVSWLKAALRKRQQYLAGGNELDFQAAPTGELANLGRGAFKGKVKNRIEEWRDR